MLVSERAREIIGLVPHNDKSLHAGTRTRVTSILSRFCVGEGMPRPGRLQPLTVRRTRLDLRSITARSHLGA